MDCLYREQCEPGLFASRIHGPLDSSRSDIFILAYQLWTIHNYFRVNLVCIIPDPCRTFDSILIQEPFQVKLALTSKKLFLHWVQGWTTLRWGSKISKDRIKNWKSHFSHQSLSKMSLRNPYKSSVGVLGNWNAWRHFGQ